MLPAALRVAQVSIMATTFPEKAVLDHPTNGSPVPISPRTSPDGGSLAHATGVLASWFRLLADETRLRILVFLLETPELNVRSLCELLQLSQPAVSHHLALLRADGLIACRRSGKNNFYRLLPQPFTQLLGAILRAIPTDEPRQRITDHLLTVLQSRDVSD